MSPILGIWASQNYVRSTNSYESIATQTVGAGGAANISFTSIPSTYKHLQIRYICRDNSAGAYVNNLDGWYNDDTTYTNYYWHLMEGVGTTGGYSADGIQVSSVRMSFGIHTSASALANNFGSGVIDIFDYANTNKKKVFRNVTGTDNNGTGDVAARMGSGVWNNTNAITKITLAPQTGSFVQYSHFALYGIKG